MSKYNCSSISYDRPAPEPHFIPGYTGHCPDLENQIGIAYPIATYLILRDRPDVASILSDMYPSRSTKHGSQKGKSSKDRHTSRNHMKGTGKNGYKSSCHDGSYGHRCSSKQVSENTRDGKKDRKRWNTEGSQKRDVKNNGCGRKHNNLEVDITFGNNMKPNSYECGAESHRHLRLAGNMGSAGQHQGVGDNFDGSEGHKHSSSGECAVKNMSKFIEAQKDLFCKMVSDVEKEQVKDTHPPCCNSLDFYKRTHCSRNC